MTTLIEELNLPDGTAPRSIEWFLYVVGDDGDPYPAAYDETGTQIGRASGHPTGTGLMRIKNVVPNAVITPAGTRYGLVLTGPGVVPDIRFLLVPDSVGEITVESCLSDPPGALTSPQLELEVIRAMAAEADLQAQIDDVEVGAGGHYRHVQSVAAAVWTVVHNLGYRPGGIYVENSAHAEVRPRIEHIDVTTLTLSFFANGLPVAEAGEADIS